MELTDFYDQLEVKENKISGIKRFIYGMGNWFIHFCCCNKILEAG
jgi:hypothetical protein